VLSNQVANGICMTQGEKAEEMADMFDKFLYCSTSVLLQIWLLTWEKSIEERIGFKDHKLGEIM